MKSWNLREMHPSAKPVVSSGKFFVTFWALELKAVHKAGLWLNFKPVCFVAPPVAPVLQTALPSHRLKLDQLLVAAVGFAWVIIVFETELQTFNKACLSLWLCTRNRLFHGSQNGKWNHCPRYQIYFGLFFLGRRVNKLSCCCDHTCSPVSVRSSPDLLTLYVHWKQRVRYRSVFSMLWPLHYILSDTVEVIFINLFFLKITYIQHWGFRTNHKLLTSIIKQLFILTTADTSILEFKILFFSDLQIKVTPIHSLIFQLCFDLYHLLRDLTFPSAAISLSVFTV